MLAGCLGLLLAGACTGSTGDVPPLPDTAAATEAIPTIDSAAMRAVADSADSVRRAVPVATDVRMEVDLTARQLHLYRGAERIATHRVAVGSTEWPTRTGEWNIVQVVWNPEWVPPDESWAEEREPKKPGAPDNPLGHAQLVYDPPRSIHGTNDSTSIGKAVSHGSIRVTNQVAKQLARQLMEVTGALRDDAWYQATQTSRTTKQIVDLPKSVPIRVF